ncbi:AMP-binding protein [Quisquiliibacterium transsilvanicum]|uniref:Long-chain acyl-CoA synthetase n=1 Tax=Quisquiliibacterium transsilvanicum TaxID=1549638 RepID=A0A7W8HJS0_9BURK|nr:long-chain acyl-CoA synthetase [Quisquiliibacterium transsilvanicum]
MHPYVHAQSTPDKPALIFASTGQAVTFRELDERSNQVAHLFRSLGLVAGDRIAILLENHPRYFELCWGAQRSGIIYTAMSTRLTSAEAAYIASDCGAKLVVSSKAMEKTAVQLRGEAPGVRHWLMIDGTADGYASWEAAVSAQPTTRIADESAGTDMLYSSGTTGRPKGVFVPPDSPAIDATNPLIEVSRNVYGLTPDSIYLSPAPLYHAAPLRFTMTVQRLGGTVVVMEHFDPEQYLQLVEKYKVTHSQLVPTMFVRMLKLPEEVRRKYDLSTLRCAIHAAAPCPVPVKQQMIDWWGPIIWEYYAGTEGNGMTMIDSANWLTHKGTVGRAVIGKLKICDDETGAELPVGKVGTVFFADGRPFSYHNDPEKTAGSTNAKGWTTLGDVGYVDEEGYLYLTDRKAYMIISGGVNIYPQEAENVLITHPKVADCAVLGVPNEEFGEEVKAVVQPRDMADAGPELEQELIAFCRQHLSAIKCPKTIDFDAELPRHPTGKLYKRLLKDRYWSGHTTKIV